MNNINGSVHIKAQNLQHVLNIPMLLKIKLPETQFTHTENNIFMILFDFVRFRFPKKKKEEKFFTNIFVYEYLTNKYLKYNYTDII